MLLLRGRYWMPDTGYWILDTGYWILAKQNCPNGGIENIQNPGTRNQDQLLPAKDFLVTVACQNI